jgi:DNA polymerase-3 subunit delta
MDAATALSMTGGSRLVQVRGASEALITRFEDLAGANAIEALVVVEADSLDGRSKLRRLFEKAPNLAAIACYGDDGPGLAAFIRQVMKTHDIKLDPDALEYLAGNLGGDRRQTRGELEKLALMVGRGGAATLSDVAISIGDSGSLALDDIAYATADGDGPGLDRALHRARADGENAVRIVRSVITHFQRLHQAAALVGAGTSPDAVVGGLRPPVFWSRRARFEAQLRIWSTARLENCLDRLSEAEVRCKSTGIPDDAVCAQTLIGICLSRRPAGRGTRAR